MIESCTTLYPNASTGLRVSEYARENSAPLSEKLVKYHDWVLATQHSAYWTISPLEAQMLIWQARMMNAKRVLEIGTFVGFSVAAWCHAVGGDGTVTGLEKSPEWANLSREKLKQYGFDNAEVITGDALESLSKLEPEQPYDIVFIDAQKSEYPDYLQKIIDKSQPGQGKRLLRPGGLIIGDNAMRAALVADASDDNPATKTVPRTTANWDWDSVSRLQEFNKLMCTHARVDAMLLPVFDGLGLGRLRD